MAWFVKIEEGIVDKSTFDKYLSAHKAYVRDLIAKGHQARSGYWVNWEEECSFSRQLRWMRRKRSFPKTP